MEGERPAEIDVCPAAEPVRATAALSRAAIASRNHSIDAFRVVANFGIVWVHAAPFLALTFDPEARFCGELLNQVVRVATPFFFLAAHG